MQAINKKPCPRPVSRLAPDSVTNCPAAEIIEDDRRRCTYACARHERSHQDINTSKAVFLQPCRRGTVCRLAGNEHTFLKSREDEIDKCRGPLEAVLELVYEDNAVRATANKDPGCHVPVLAKCFVAVTVSRRGCLICSIRRPAPDQRVRWHENVICLSISIKATF